MQRTLNLQDPFHIAIIMDGNGRWAERRGLPRAEGHRAGAQAARRIVEAASELGASVLTLFAFSSDNWRRPKDEVGFLMSLMHLQLRLEFRRLITSGLRLSVIGRRDRLPQRLLQDITRAEQATANNRGLHLRIALDYSSRDAISQAAMRLAANSEHSPADFDRLISDSAGGECWDVDLLIRTGGEKRLSDFLLWESAYAELWFTDKMWPDFEAGDLESAVEDFRGRERRFGGLPVAPPPATAAMGRR